MRTAHEYSDAMIGEIKFGMWESSSRIGNPRSHSVVFSMGITTASRTLTVTMNC